MSTPGPTRRLVLAAGATGAASAALAVIAGCVRAGAAEPAPSTSAVRRSPAASEDPDRSIRRPLAIGTLALIARYQATAARHPVLRRRLAALVADHRAHLTALTGVRAGRPAAGTPDPAKGAPVPAGIRVPARPAAAVRALAAAEEAAAAYRFELVGIVSSASFAALLAAIAASQTTHAGLLRAGRHELVVEPAPAGQLPAGPLAPFAVDALQDALAAEHAAAYGYGTLGAWLTGGALARAHEAHDAHRRRRDRLDQFLRRAGGEPAVAAPAYRLPFTISSGERARRLAVGIEDGVADAYGWLVAAADRGSSLRTDAAGWLTEAAVRAASWRGASRALPGLPDRR